MGQFLFTIGWLALCYLLGSVPFGLVIGQAACRIDPRHYGSRNTGATNVARTCGTKYGVGTLLLDIGKGGVPVALAMVVSTSPWFLSLTGAAVLLGHMFSVFLDGKGGKGVATTIGVFLVLSFWPLFWSLVLCLLLIWWTGFVSVGSLALVTALPVLLAVFGQWGFVPLALVVLLLVYWRHRENIERLAKGAENPWR
ncbi:glycerol-3-phosphate 1-O-acyltransferase PlsY [Desulfohalobium retbaense]|uniref:Glycerol-3-phosphate acyltransferase n=1 Tax=Desulfohalobium retbaense (strain ATCC 49708 / DSM 5692 / JCM 16813 / HR100) TaxID=485915 RepID=C8X571_DESRD|nr:glycerol-3-phosphate 1-O-acyltransferase PlsY [Desulfohalobium retbaense]ACV69568.1 protein of unknown function DUF205 [Desulfohalobium retbaense DSM 5692]